MKRKTTLTVAAADLETIRAEAARRGVSLNVVLSDISADRAAEIRSRRRPRLGIGGSGRSDLSRQSVEDEASAARGPWRG